MSVATVPALGGGVDSRDLRLETEVQRIIGAHRSRPSERCCRYEQFYRKYQNIFFKYYFLRNGIFCLTRSFLDLLSIKVFALEHVARKKSTICRGVFPPIPDPPQRKRRRKAAFLFGAPAGIACRALTSDNQILEAPPG